MLTESQFRELLETLRGQMGDHDLLIEINTRVKTAQEGHTQFREEVVTKMGIVEKAVGAAHRRIDWITVGGLITVLSVVISVGTLVLRAR